MKRKIKLYNYNQNKLKYQQIYNKLNQQIFNNNNNKMNKNIM